MTAIARDLLNDEHGLRCCRWCAAAVFSERTLRCDQCGDHFCGDCFCEHPCFRSPDHDDLLELGGPG